MNYNSIKSLLLTLIINLTISSSILTPQIEATTLENYTEMGLALATIPLDMTGHHYATKNKTKRAAAFYILRDLLSILNKAVYFHNYTSLTYDGETDSFLSTRDGLANGAFLVHDLIKLYQDINLFRGPRKSKPTFFEKEADGEAALEEHEVSGVAYAWRVATLPLLKGLTAFAIALSQDQSRAYACAQERYSAASAHSLTRLLDEYTELESDSPHKKKLLTLIIANAVWFAYELKGYIEKRIELGKSFGVCTLCSGNGIITALSCGHNVCQGQGCQARRVALTCGHSACRECLAPRLTNALNNNDRAMLNCMQNGCHGRLNITEIGNITRNNQQSIDQFHTLMHPVIQECGLCMDEGQSSTLQCGHTYCRTCLQDHIRIAIRDRNLQGLSCPSQGCQHRLSIPDVIDITDNNQNTLDRFGRAIIELTPGTRQCPTSGCGTFFPNPEHQAQDHACERCNAHYCSRCLIQHPNNTMTCLEALRIVDPVRENELAQNARRCSRCITPIQRTHGCNHMTCPCGHQFCYIDGNDWHHNHYGCRTN